MPYNESPTGRTLPLKFKSDLNSRTLNIVCRIIIERNNFNTGESKNIYLSTHKMNFAGNY